VLSASPLLALTALPGAALAQTPATPESLSPEEVFAALLAAPFDSPLLPADSGDIVVTEWIDDSDDDLAGAIGGLTFGQAGQGFEAAIGAMIVYPEIQMASDRVNLAAYSPMEGDTARAVEILGYTGISLLSPARTDDHVDEGFATVAIAAGSVIISGGAGELPDAELELRALANCIALLDHFRRVTG
jgi:hypothetical protein